MFDHLQIYNRRERMAVGVADALLSLARPLVRRGNPQRPMNPTRILLMRLERIGDLLMALDAIGDVVRAAPQAEIDLAVGSWNAAIARAIPGITRVETVDASWLAREERGASLPALLARARSWRDRRYDLAINFEPDVRSNLMLAATGAKTIAGFSTAGGGPLLDIALRYDPRAHTSDNAARLVAAALDVPPAASPAHLRIPAEAQQRAAQLLRGRRGGPMVGIHASGGRPIKQWEVTRFAEVAAMLVANRGATIVLTGAPGDRAIVDLVRSAIPATNAIDIAGEADLLTLAAVLQQIDVLVTGDTGPMHLAAAVGTPVVAVFGPSDPARYAPRGSQHRIIRIDLPCSPCNRIRLPPERCSGHTPDCLAGIDAVTVFDAAARVLDARMSA